jgi:uncharacterized protein (TIGR02001 family)
MKKTVIALSLAAMTLPAIAQKAAEPEFSVSGNFGLFSDYRFRGVSQTDLDPALQGGFDLTHKSGFYLGTWASSVSEFANPEGNGMEIDAYGGYRWSVGEVSFDIGNLYYYYPGSVKNADGNKVNTNEVYVGIGYGPLTFKTSYSTSDYFGIDKSDGTLYYDLSGAFALSDGLTLKAHVGYVDVAGRNGFTGTDYKIGLAKDIGGFVFGIDYVGTSGDLKDLAEDIQVDGSGKTEDLGKGGLVLSISKTF